MAKKRSGPFSLKEERQLMAKALRSGIRLVESFLTGLSCSQQNFPQSIAGRLPIWRHDRRSSARLPCADGAPPQWRFQTAIVRKTRVLLIASATDAVLSASRYSGFRSPGRPPVRSTVLRGGLEPLQL